ncbi:MAG TPA: HAMP domain-containing sensor histidine kinase [Gemmatimonadaceae bacterium]|nr:HAMP domain-containing sensor histidine kinase [Gemmatimonadaceae bacterium]
MPDVEVALTDRDVPRGLALLCSRDGIVQRVLRDDLGILGDIRGQRLSSLVDGSSRDKAQRFLAEVVTTGAAFDWELSVPRDGGVRLLHFAAATTDENSVVVVAAPSRLAVVRYYDELMRVNNEQANALRAALKPETVQAVRDRDADLYEKMARLNSELATAQRELMKKNLELERANQLKNQFLGMAAHDLRNPIGAIRSFSELLLDPTFPVTHERQQDFLRRIRGSSEFMLALINDLLDLSAIEAGQLRMDAQDVDIAQLVRENVELNRVLAAEKQIEITLTMNDDVPRIHADARKVEQILNNLLSNAVKFSRTGTTVRVDARAGDGGIWFIVADEGPGIPAGELATIFRPFQRATPQSTAGEHSTGLGLAIVKRLVDGHGGRLSVESEVGRGTTFSVWLPVARG